MILLCLGIGFLAAEQLNVLDVSALQKIDHKTKISKIDLYSDGAYVQREVNLVLKPGVYRVELSGLPEELDVAKMNIELEGAELLRVDSEFAPVQSTT